jgi:hypothetical protein
MTIKMKDVRIRIYYDGEKYYEVSGFIPDTYLELLRSSVVTKTPLDVVLSVVPKVKEEMI